MLVAAAVAVVTVAVVTVAVLAAVSNSKLFGTRVGWLVGAATTVVVHETLVSVTHLVPSTSFL